MNNDIAVAQICKIVTVRHGYCTTKIAYLIKHNYKNQSIAAIAAAVMVATAQTSAGEGGPDFFLENIVTMCQGNWSIPRRKGTSRVNLLTSVITVASSHSTNHGLVNDFVTII